MSRSGCAVGASGLVVGGAVSEGGGVVGCVPFARGEAMPFGGGLIGVQSRWVTRTSDTFQRGLLGATKSRHVVMYLMHDMDYLSVGLVLLVSDPFCLEFKLLTTPSHSFIVSVYFITHNA